MAMVEHGLKVAGAKTKLLSEQAMELLWRVCHGLPRQASRLLRTSLMLAHERDQNFVDEHVMLDACEEMQLVRPSKQTPELEPRDASSRTLGKRSS